jgi:hypothetical protein
MKKSYRSNDIAGAIRELIPMDKAARFYGFEPTRSGFICCPFHHEKTASLKLYESGWKCFGCGKGGSVIDFVMELYEINFTQAVVRLNSDFSLGLTSSRATPSERSKILAKRRMEAMERERVESEYMAMTREFAYWWEIKKEFAPGRDGWVHPFYAEAVKRLPALEYWLEENSIGR